MTFEERLAELGVDLSDLKLPNPLSYDSISDAMRAYHAYYAETLDRMETRIVNLTGERDFLITQIEQDCLICANSDPKNHRICAKYDILPDDCFEFAGVPEDWRPDDD